MKFKKLVAVLSVVTVVAGLQVLNSAPAEALQCVMQCQNSAGGAVGKKVVLPISSPKSCLISGTRKLKSECAGTGTVKFGSCYGRMKDGKIRDQNISVSC